MSNYVSKSKVLTHNGESWLVNANHGGLFTGTLKNMIDQIYAMFSYHNKLFLLRFDLHQPSPTDNSEHVSKFISAALKIIMRKYKLKRSIYVWAREIESAAQQHYHCFLVLDGNKVQSPRLINKILGRAWRLYFDGVYNWPSMRCYYQLNKKERHVIQWAIFHISYLAKYKGKNGKKRYSHNFGMSQLKPKN
jgi:hypothetical protein